MAKFLISLQAENKGPFKLTLLGPWKFKAVNCSPVIYLLRSGAHRFLLRYKAILFTDLTEKIWILSPTGLGVFSVFSTTSAYLTVLLYSVFFSGKEDLIRRKLFVECKASSSYFFSAGIIFQNADEMTSLGTEALKKAINGVTEQVSSTRLDLSRDISESYFDEEITDPENDFTQEPLSIYPSAHNLCPLSRAPRPRRFRVKYGLQVRRLNYNLKLSATFFYNPTDSFFDTCWSSCSMMLY